MVVRSSFGNVIIPILKSDVVYIKLHTIPLTIRRHTGLTFKIRKTQCRVRSVYFRIIKHGGWHITRIQDSKCVI